jgi:FKBP-type peptidyl-prolyl cis-trans isomerase FklB
MTLLFYNLRRSSLHPLQVEEAGDYRSPADIAASGKSLTLLPVVRINARIIAMRKLFLTAASTLSVAILMLGTIAAQQTPAATPKPATAAKPTTSTKPHTAATAAKTTQPLTLKTQKDKLSYAIGMNIGQSMKKDSLDIDPAIVQRGLKDAMSGAKPLMTDEEAKAIMTEFRTAMTKKKEAEAQQIGEANKQAGQQFLAANKDKPGVVALPSGLQYKILKEGTGPKPTATDTVVCNYRGTLINGTEFDSSYKGGQPATFPVNQVIKGWTEVLQLMPVGSKWQVFVPSDLAYGAHSPAPEIGPNSMLIFEIDLLSIQEKKQ